MNNKDPMAAAAAALLSTLAPALAPALAQDNETTKRLDLRDFERIEISGVYELDVEVGPDFSIILEGDADELDRVKAEVRGGALKLSQKDDRSFWRGRNRDGVEATITLPRLSGIDVSGVVDGAVRNIDADDFEIEISGVGDVEFDGRCKTLDASVSGVGDLDAERLECLVVDVSVSGVGDASVYASEEVDARVSGMGDIDVYGSPSRVSKSDSMFAEVTVH